MSRKRRKSPVDPSEYSGVVVCCPRCAWREVLPDSARGWYALARHLKVGHGDEHAGQHARRLAYKLGYSAG